jgi:hypothetical protein
MKIITISLIKSLVIFLVFFTSSVFSTSDKDESLKPKIHIATVTNTEIIAPFQKLMLKAYSQNGYRVAFHPTPAGRSLTATNKGEFDAELIRISVIEEAAPNLIRVPVVLTKGELKLYCLISVRCDKSILDDSSQVIGVLRGFNLTSKYMEKRNASVYSLPSTDSLGKIIEKNRLEYILTVQNKKLGNAALLDEAKYQSITLSTFNAYHYLHKKHKDLIPKLTETLNKLLAARK